MPHPDKYDMPMDIATEEFSQLEIAGATIQRLLGPTAGELKDQADQSETMDLLKGKAVKKAFIHKAMVKP